MVWTKIEIIKGSRWSHSTLIDGPLPHINSVLTLSICYPYDKKINVGGVEGFPVEIKILGRGGGPRKIEIREWGRGDM